MVVNKEKKSRPLAPVEAGLESTKRSNAKTITKLEYSRQSLEKTTPGKKDTGKG